MPFLESPKSDFMLQASLEELHDASREWLYELEFLHEEIRFFYLLLRKSRWGDFPDQELAGLEADVITLHGDEFGCLRRRVEKHEHALAMLFRGEGVQDEDAYRKEHRLLVHEINQAKMHLKKFKARVFEFARRSDVITL